MKSFVLSLAALVMSFSLAINDAEAAKRLGGGRSSGIQRESISQQRSATPAPGMPAQNQVAPAAKQPAGAPAQAQPKRSWMGPLAGLAAGLGLAALASHFGFGEELASMMMFGLLAMAAIGVIGFLLRRKAGTQQPALAGAAQGMQYSGSAQDFGQSTSTPAQAAPVAAAATARATSNIPADFDTDGFVRNAKVNFIRLQAANDAGNLDDIREFTTPEMFAEIKLNFGDRNGASQKTDVVMLNAEVLEVTEEAARYLVSVRFHGMLREDGAESEAFDEVWHMVKPRSGNQGWVLGGIQQMS